MSLEINDSPGYECPGTEPSTLARLIHKTQFLLWFVPIASLGIVFFGTILGLILLLAPLFFIVALLMFVANIVQGCLGRLRERYELQPLQQAPQSIRLLEILPGNADDLLQCNMVHGRWDESVYEALSYTWSCELRITPYCWVGDRYLDIGRTLHRALRYLRHPHRVRTIWIDALCINQEDNQEKSAQVQQMREIYANAQGVVVWLDVDSWCRLKTDCLEDAFRTIRDLVNVGVEGTEYVWPERLGDESSVWSNINLLLSLEWWSRVWIIQEVASNSRVTVQCRSHTIGWDDLYAFLSHPTARHYLDMDEGKVKFIERVQALRHKDAIDPTYGLLSLTHDFRFSKASNERDKLYALRGLVKSPSHQSQAPVDYSIDENVMWKRFAKESLQKYRTLSVLALAECSSSSWASEGKGTVSWSPQVSNWQSTDIPFGNKDPRGVRQPLWFATDETLASIYSASGTTLARCRTALADPDIIGVQGFVYDRVDSTISESYDCLWPEDRRSQSMRTWKMATAKYSAQFWEELEDSMRSTASQSGTLFPVGNVTTDAFHRRRLIVTQHNRAVGLVRSECQPGDLVCILLGSDVPYILRKSIHEGPAYRHSWTCLKFGCVRARHKKCCFPELFTNRGQAYVEGIMRYPGDIEEDIENGVIDLQEFFLE
jgi:hypothetical protein